MKKFLRWYIPLFLCAALVIFIVYKTSLAKPQDEAVAGVVQEEQSAGTQTESGEAAPLLPPPEIVQKGNDRVTAGASYSGKLVEPGTRNVLIIGEDQLNDLYDTIGVASIDEKAGKLKLIMIPRDTYIEYNSEIMDYLDKAGKSKSPGIYKINFAHSIGGMVKYKGKFDSGPISFLAQVIKEKFGIDVDDFVKINTKGFASMIDLFGGIDIKVPYLMNYDDPTQDLHIHINKGMQHLDGENAEGFVRFRQGYKEDGTLFQIGDPGRKENQLNFLKAFIAQHGSIKEINKLPSLISLLGKNVQHSIGVGDLLQTYIKLAEDIVNNKYDIETENLESDKMIRIDGSSYIVFE